MKLPSSLMSVLAPAWVASAVLVLMSPASPPLLADDGGGGPATVSASVFATGLNNPRGLRRSGASRVGGLESKGFPARPSPSPMWSRWGSNRSSPLNRCLACQLSG